MTNDKTPESTTSIHSNQYRSVLLPTAFVALLIAIVTVFYPSILRAGTARLGSIAPTTLHSTHQMATQTTTSTKLTPKEMREWNQ